MKLIYFDNAATSHYKPFCVKLSFLKTLIKSANAGRGGHKLSIENSMLIWKTREKIAKYFGNIEPENVIFTKNCTEALNLVLQGLAKKKKGNVVCSCFEHNSVLRPLSELEKEGKISLTIIYPENKQFITVNDVKKNIKKDTFLVCVNSISNVTGNKNDYQNIGKFCNDNKILFLLDNAQGVGHIKVDMKKDHINFLTFSGHKGFLTPQGIGCLCINSQELPRPIIFGGTGTESDNLMQPLTPPESFESGTQSTSLIYSLFSGINYIEKHFVKINKKINDLSKYLYDNLKNNKNLTIYTKNYENGVISFNINGYDSIQVCEFLDKNYNIATRGGLHCAPLTHKFYNTTKIGMVRVSLSFKNTKKELNILLSAISDLIKNKQKI